jgi:hypothetical protein
MYETSFATQVVAAGALMATFAVLNTSSCFPRPPADTNSGSAGWLDRGRSGI